MAGDDGLREAEQIATVLGEHHPRRGMVMSEGVTCSCGYWTGSQRQPPQAVGSDGLDWHRAQQVVAAPAAAGPAAPATADEVVEVAGRAIYGGAWSMRQTDGHEPLRGSPEVRGEVLRIAQAILTAASPAVGPATEELRRRFANAGADRDKLVQQIAHEAAGPASGEALLQGQAVAARARGDWTAEREALDGLVLLERQDGDTEWFKSLPEDQANRVIRIATRAVRAERAAAGAATDGPRDGEVRALLDLVKAARSLWTGGGDDDFDLHVARAALDVRSET